MIYLSGSTNDEIQAAMIERGYGLITTPNTGYAPERVARFPYWGLDNGAYTARWEETKWLDWLAQQPTERCLFAVAPDVYPDAKASLERGMKYADLIHGLGLPVAIVAQDDGENLAYPWDDFDCLFIGGKRDAANPDGEWKLSTGATELVQRARSQGTWVHMGRVNSLKRMERARAMGCHSADGTFIGKGPRTNLPRADHWMRWLSMHRPFPQMTAFETPSLPLHREVALAMDARFGAVCEDILAIMDGEGE